MRGIRQRFGACGHPDGRRQFPVDPGGLGEDARQPRLQLLAGSFPGDHLDHVGLQRRAGHHLVAHRVDLETRVRRIRLQLRQNRFHQLDVVGGLACGQGDRQCLVAVRVEILARLADRHSGRLGRSPPPPQEPNTGSSAIPSAASNAASALLRDALKTSRTSPASQRSISVTLRVTTSGRSARAACLRAESRPPPR